jgi:hypothetical protein
MRTESSWVSYESLESPAYTPHGPAVVVAGALLVAGGALLLLAFDYLRRRPRSSTPWRANGGFRTRARMSA